MAVPPSSFEPTGRKKAVLVGINYKGTDAELKGCVRDVKFMHHLLTTKFGFDTKHMHILTDEPHHISGARQGMPTKRHILQSLEWLMEDSQPGDSLWFSFSGHGSQVRDASGDEDDGYDETLLPVDFRKAGQIVDDELYNLVRPVCKGARLTALIDACHSGSALDLPYAHDVFNTGGTSGGTTTSATGGSSLSKGLLNVANALLSGHTAEALSVGLSLASSRWRHKELPPNDPNLGETLMFSGCMDSQTSADTNKLTGGLSTGAMTFAFIDAFENSRVGHWGQYDFHVLLQTMRNKLGENGMRQIPQFSTAQPFNVKSRFML